VSLQGSLDTFALPDVLVLLASTKKSGELHVAGSRVAGLGHHPDTEGRLWFDAGGLVGHDVGQALEPSDAVFELLRLAQGTFSFLAGTPSGGGPRVEIEGILGEAQARLEEWREIEAVVPSLDAWLQLCPEPPLAHVSMRGEQWRLVVAVGAGGAVGGVLGQLGLAELPGCRAVKELVEAGLVNLVAQAPGPLPSFWKDVEPTTTSAAFDEPAREPEVVFHATDEAGAGVEPVYSEPSDHYEGYELDTPAEPPAAWTVPAPAEAWTEPEQPALAPEPADERVPAMTTGVPDWRTELGDLPDLDAIASLPPKRRRADLEPEEAGTVAATLDDTDEGVEGDEQLNRGLLLKFLSSVRN